MINNAIIDAVLRFWRALGAASMAVWPLSRCRIVVCVRVSYPRIHRYNISNTPFDDVLRASAVGLKITSILRMRFGISIQRFRGHSPFVAGHSLIFVVSIFFPPHFRVKSSSVLLGIFCVRHFFASLCSPHHLSIYVGLLCRWAPAHGKSASPKIHPFNYPILSGDTTPSHLYPQGVLSCSSILFLGLSM